MIVLATKGRKPQIVIRFASLRPAYAVSQSGVCVRDCVLTAPRAPSEQRFQPVFVSRGSLDAFVISANRKSFKSRRASQKQEQQSVAFCGGSCTWLKASRLAGLAAARASVARRVATAHRSATTRCVAQTRGLKGRY